MLCTKDHEWIFKAASERTEWLYGPRLLGRHPSSRPLAPEVPCACPSRAVEPLGPKDAPGHRAIQTHGPFRRTGPTAGKGVIVSDDTGIGHFVLSHLD
jgi:hypothetical protein